MKRRRSRLLLPVIAFGVPALIAMHSALAPAAENFACGAGGSPNAKTGTCNCPAGKIEKTVGGTSRCVDRPVGPKPSGKPTTTTTVPPTPSNTTVPTPSNTTVPTVTLPSCAPSQIPTIAGCVERCAADHVWQGNVCVDRCRADEAWTGSGCEKDVVETPTCTDGKVVDPTGHCCFAGQVWVESRGGLCRGVPSCPGGYVAAGETCVLGTCEAGMERVGDGLHCCWPGQDWSGATRSCVGLASCTEGYESSPSGCSPLRLCDPGKVAVDAVHCCFPNQHWTMRGDGEVGCGGVPACPAPLIARGEDCAAADKVAEDDDRISGSASFGAKYYTLDFGYSYVIGADSWKWQLYTLGYAYHLPAIPIRFAGTLYYGKANLPCSASSDPKCGGSSSGGTATASGYSVGVAFAPFSSANYVTTPVSMFNPWIGFDYRGFAFSGATDVARPTPGGAGVLSIGNVSLLGSVALTYSLAFALFGNESKPTTTISVALGFAGPSPIPTR